VGGAELTDTGKRVLALYRQMHQASLEAMKNRGKKCVISSKRSRDRVFTARDLEPSLLLPFVLSAVI